MTVRAADRLIYYWLIFRAFSTYTVKCTLMDYYSTSTVYFNPGSATQAHLTLLPQKWKTQKPQSPSSAFHAWVAWRPWGPLCLGLQAVPADDIHPLAHLDLPRIVAPLQHLVGAIVLVRHRLCRSPSRHIDPMGGMTASGAEGPSAPPGHSLGGGSWPGTTNCCCRVASAADTRGGGMHALQDPGQVILPA